MQKRPESGFGALLDIPGPIIALYDEASKKFQGWASI
jgi:hypothetical protein